MGDDLTEDWEAIKGIPSAKGIAPDVNLREEWMGMGDFPEFIYKIIDSQDSFHCMAVWRMKCVGQKFFKRTGYNRMKSEDCWVARYERPLWQGERAREGAVPPPEGFVKEDRWRKLDLSRLQAVSKKLSHTTIAGVRKEFITLREKHLERMREDIKRWRESMATLQRDVDHYECTIAEMDGFVPKLEVDR